MATLWNPAVNRMTCFHVSVSQIASQYPKQLVEVSCTWTKLFWSILKIAYSWKRSTWAGWILRECLGTSKCSHSISVYTYMLLDKVALQWLNLKTAWLSAATLTAKAHSKVFPFLRWQQLNSQFKHSCHTKGRMGLKHQTFQNISERLKDISCTQNSSTT